MKKFAFIAAAAALFAMPSAAFAEGLYGKVEAGVGVSGDADNDLIGTVDLETGYQVGAAIGYGLTNGVRVEGELSYLKNDIDTQGTGLSADVTATSLLANAYYDFAGGKKVRPFVGAGFGWVNGEASASAGGLSASIDDDGWAYQVKAGVSIAHSERATWDIGYRYFKADFENTEATVHGVTVALRFKLGA